MSKLSILQNIIGFVSFWGIVICFVFSFSKEWKTWSPYPYLPLVGTLLLIANEIVLSSSHVEIIRIDLVITVPILVFLWLNTIIQISMMKSKKLDIYIHNTFSGIQNIQILLALLIILAISLMV